MLREAEIATAELDHITSTGAAEVTLHLTVSKTDVKALGVKRS